MLKYVFLALSLCLLKVSCLFRSGSCPTISYPNQSFLIKNYMGKWYEYARLKDDTVETGNCVVDNYKLNRDGSFNSTITEYTDNGFNKIHGRVLPTNIPFLFSGNWAGSDGSLNGFLFNVFTTDYDSFTVEYSCTDVPGGRNEFLYMNFRKNKITQTRFENLLEFIKTTLDITPDLLDFTRVNC